MARAVCVCSDVQLPYLPIPSNSIPVPPFDLPASSICLRFANAASVSRPPSACCQDGIVIAPTSYCLTSIGVTTPSRFWRVVTFHASNPDSSRHAAVALSYRIYIPVVLRLLFPSICRQDGVVSPLPATTSRLLGFPIPHDFGTFRSLP